MRGRNRQCTVLEVTMQEVSKVKILWLIPTKFIIISKKLTISVRVGKINNIYYYVFPQVQMGCSVYLECVDLKLYLAAKENM